MSAFRVLRRLRDLLDVDTTGAAVGDALVLDADGETWVPGAGGGGGDVTDAVILAPPASARNVIQPTGGAVIAAILKAHASQSVDLTQWQKSDATVLARITKDGSFQSGPTADVSNLVLTGLDGRTAPIIKLVDLVSGFAPPNALELYDLNNNPLLRMYVEKFASGTNRSGRTGGAAYTAAGVQIGSLTIDGAGYIDMGVEATRPYPIYCYDFDTGAQIFTVTKAGNPIFGGHAATASGDLEASNFSFWLTDTNGAAALNVKAKQADGTVKTLVIPVTNGTGALVGDLASYQPLDSDLTAIAGLSPTNDDFLQRKSGAWSNRTVAQVLTDLGIASNYQPLDADLTAIAGLADPNADRILFWDDSAGAYKHLAPGTGLTITGTTIDASAGGSVATDAIFDAKGDLPVGTGADTAAKLTVGANDRLLIADSSQATGLRWATPAEVRTALALVVGTNVQAYDADLTTWAGLTPSAFFQTLVDDADAAAARTTLGIPAVVGGAEWTVVTKASDESVASSTAVQNDDELFFTAASGGLYEIELNILWASPAGGGTPDLKYDLGEDSTHRGTFVNLSQGTGDAKTTGNSGFMAANQTEAVPVGGAAINRSLFLKGGYVGAGGTFRFRWAQNTSDSNATIVRAGSILRYRRLV